MKVRIRFFAQIREAIGTPEIALYLPGEATVENLLAQLQARYSSLRLLPRDCMVSVNLEYVGRDHILKEGDEVGLIPPVSGGDHV